MLDILLRISSEMIVEGEKKKNKKGIVNIVGSEATAANIYGTKFL